MRPRLISFALMHLRDRNQAEDAVQEVLMSAIEKNESFAGRSGYETWGFGILKYKILDTMGFSTDDIFRELGIKENNCWVILHRARLRLRACIEKGWLEEETAS